jgi:hypothetical protein
MLRWKCLVLVFVIFFAGSQKGHAAEVHFAKYEEKNGQRVLLQHGTTHRNASFLKEAIQHVSYPKFFVEHEELGNSPIIHELYATDLQQLNRRLVDLRVDTRSRWLGHLSGPFDATATAPTVGELRILATNGPSTNRVNLVFLGDGYTALEREKFFSDIERIKNEMFGAQSMSPYLPIINVYAVFVPSAESGIGYQGAPKNTYYQSFRERGELRGIYYTDRGYDRVQASCNQAPGCDYPILVANDPYYGGLGGAVSVTTSSVDSSWKVLIHELGHSIGLVGEEYDGGGYHGANYAATLDTVTWGPWLTGPLREEPSQSRVIAWPWKRLDQGAFRIPFNSDGRWSRAGMRVSLSGARTSEDIHITLNGQLQSYSGTPSGDRNFYDFDWAGFQSGPHELVFTANPASTDKVVSSLAVHEYGRDYNFAADAIGAYPLFSGNNNKMGYRPSHGTCLMRTMSSKQFCNVCRENNWHKMFRKVALIDDVQIRSVDNFAIVALKLPALGQFRSPRIRGERLSIKWFVNGQEETHLRNNISFTYWADSLRDQVFEVEVEYVSPHLRSDPEDLLLVRRQIPTSLL